MSCSVLLLASLLLLLPVSGVWASSPSPDCIGVCTYNITSVGPLNNASCSELEAARQCFMDRPILCNLTQHAPLSPELTTLSLINNLIFLKNCAVSAQTTPPPATPPVQNCPSNLPQSMGTVVNASILPQGQVSSECRDTATDRTKQLQHCSLFLDGYLRTFPAYRHGLQGCSLPGSWILFRHDKLQVEVEGTSITPGRVSLTKVNVTIFPDPCNGQRLRSYIAQSITSLPTSFSDGHTPSNAGSALQLHISSDRSVASILMVYSNFTIIIRQMSFMLSVTLQVPGRDSYLSGGLCSGCPRQQAISVTSLVQSYQLCPQHFDVLLSCINIPTFSQLTQITNASYYDTCTTALYRAFSTSTGTFINSVGMDAIKLPDDDVFPGRQSTVVPIVQEPDTSMPPLPQYETTPIPNDKTTPTPNDETTPTPNDETTPPIKVTLSLRTASSDSKDATTTSQPNLEEIRNIPSAFRHNSPLFWLLTCLLVIASLC